jgi:hypothetical protein
VNKLIINKKRGILAGLIFLIVLLLIWIITSFYTGNLPDGDKSVLEVLNFYMGIWFIVMLSAFFGLSIAVGKKSMTVITIVVGITVIVLQYF